MSSPLTPNLSSLSYLPSLPLGNFLCGNELEVGKKYFMNDDLNNEFYLGVLLKKEKFIHPYLGLESNVYNIFNFENMPDKTKVKTGIQNFGLCKVFYQLPSIV